MGQTGGSFEFQCWTGNVYADRVVIYDGRGTFGEILWQYHGLTNDEVITTIINFKQDYVTVSVEPDSDEGTKWRIMVNCPR